MPSSYLTSGDLGPYGLPASTTAASIATASTLVDAYLRRPEGLCYQTDASGAPIAMVAKTSPLSFFITSQLTPGTNVAATVQPALLTADMIGDVWLLADATPGLVEAVVIAGVPTSASVVLQSVKYAHAASVAAQTGMTLAEERSLPSKRSITRLSQTPVVSILSCLGRYTYGRRSDQTLGVYQDVNLLAMVSVFGGPPVWNPVDVSQVGIGALSGEVWVPAGALLASFSDVKISYVAGWPVGGVPAPVKMATAALIESAQNAGAFAGNLTSIKAGDTQFTRKVASLVDPDILRQLEPFKARLFY